MSAVQAADALRLAIVSAAMADTGDGGLVDLTGSSTPLLMQRAMKDVTLPVATFFFLSGQEEANSGRARQTVRFAGWAGKECGHLYVEKAAAIRARIYEIMTAANLAAYGVTAAPVRPRWRDGSPDEDGVLGLFLDLDFVDAS